MYEITVFKEIPEQFLKDQTLMIIMMKLNIWTIEDKTNKNEKSFEETKKNINSMKKIPPTQKIKSFFLFLSS